MTKDIVILAPVIAKAVITGKTKVFETKGEAEVFAKDTRSYSYPIECKDENGKNLTIYGVPK